MALQLALAQHRQQIRKPRVFRDRTNPLDCMDDGELISRYRLPRHLIVDLCDKFNDELQRKSMRNHALPVATQILVALRYYATGSMQRVDGDLHGVSQPSVSRCVNHVSTLLTRAAAEYITFHTDDVRQRTVMSDFYKIARFPNVVGCVDGTQIRILSPRVNEHVYVCRKGYHSLNVQGICDAKLRFMNIVCKYPGSAHDSFIWKNCTIYQYFEQHTDDESPRWLLGDSGYPLSSFLMTPVANPNTPAETTYNHKHCHTRNAIERAFGVWKMRFRCLHDTGGCLQSPPDGCVKVITACAVLHNLCIDNSVPAPEIDSNNPPTGGDVEMMIPSLPASTDSRNSGVITRKKLIERFA